jgi:radical SAM superfamily enzyme YgiQ (UPF0313 family)
MGKRLLLVNPVQDRKLNLSAIASFPQLALAYLAALTPPDWDVDIVDENVECLAFENADLVGITAYTCNVPRAYQVSQLFRQKGIKTVMGGVHVSMTPNEAAQFADCVVVGEAEPIWQDILNDFENGRLRETYVGKRTSPVGMVKPRRDLFSTKYTFGALVQSARGCPNDCEFCSVTTFNGGAYRQRPVEEVLDEIEELDSKNIFFADDNILGHGRQAEERAIQLFRGMTDRGFNKRWLCQAGIDFATNPDVLKNAHKAGCFGVLIGFESIDEGSLRAMNKHRNLKMGVAKYKEVIDRIHSHGIGVHGAFIFGTDADTKDVFPRTTEFILNTKIDGTQLTVLTPLPGTRLFSRLAKEGRLLRTNYPDDWKYYDFLEVTYRPRHMTPDELKEGITQMYKDTTSRVACIRRALNSAVQTRDPLKGIVTYLGNRKAGKLWMKKRRYTKHALPSGVEESHLVVPATNVETREEETSLV